MTHSQVSCFIMPVANSLEMANFIFGIYHEKISVANELLTALHKSKCYTLHTLKLLNKDKIDALNILSFGGRGDLIKFELAIKELNNVSEADSNHIDNLKYNHKKEIINQSDTEIINDNTEINDFESININLDNKESNDLQHDKYHAVQQN